MLEWRIYPASIKRSVLSKDQYQSGHHQHCTHLELNLLFLEVDPSPIAVLLYETQAMALELLSHCSNDKRFLRPACLHRCIIASMYLNHLSEELVAREVFIPFTSAAYHLHVAVRQVEFLVAIHAESSIANIM